MKSAESPQTGSTKNFLGARPWKEKDGGSKQLKNRLRGSLLRAPQDGEGENVQGVKKRP